MTGAAGGARSVAAAIFGHLGYEVAAVAGRPEAANYLKGLGAATIAPREELNGTTKPTLENERWARCVDAVGGKLPSRLLGEMRYGGSVAAVGVAESNRLEASVIASLLREVNRLGLDSVMHSHGDRLEAWRRTATDRPMGKLEAMIQPATRADLPAFGGSILEGGIKGRVVVDVSA